VSDGQHLSHVVHFGDQQVFDGATTYTCLLFLNKSPAKECRFVKVDDLTAWRADRIASEGSVTSKQIASSEWNFTVGRGADLFEKLARMPVTLGDIADRMAQGIRTSANDVYVLDIVADNPKVLTAFSKQLDAQVKLERESVYGFLQGREIKRYCVLPSGKVVIIPYRASDGHMTLIGEGEYERSYPRAFKYLRDCREYLEKRERGRMKCRNWYGYVYPKNLEVMQSPKILVPDIADRASFALDENGEYAFTSGYGITLKPATKESPKYILGLLNSTVLDFYLKRISTTMRGGFFRYFTQFIGQHPIRPVDYSNNTDKSTHDRKVSLVQSMLDLHQQLAAAKTDHEKTALNRQIDATDRQIDTLVYDLYGLTDDEIKIVEDQA